MQEVAIDPTFGQLVEQEMKKRGDTRAVAAVKMEISTSMLSDLLTGRPRNYSMTSLKKICEYAHLSADRVLGLTEPSDDSSVLHTASYVTGLSPKALEMLAGYNASDWAQATGRSEPWLEPAKRRRASNKLLEDEGFYMILSTVTRYFENIEKARESVDPGRNEELHQACMILDKYGYSALPRFDLARIERQAATGAFEDLLRRVSGEEAVAADPSYL